MKQTLTNIVQKCLCCNFIINELIKYNDSPSKNLFVNIKKENLKHIKTLCYLYEYLYLDVLIPENVNKIDLSKTFNENLSYLFKLFFEIISDLKILNSKIYNPYYKHLISKLIFSYFGFTSSINCIFPTISNRESKIKNFTLSVKREDNYILSDNESRDHLREVCIDSVEFFFDYPLKSKYIKDEAYEVFFENDSNNKFYQYFFDCDDRYIKIRISVKNSSVFYMYQVLKNSIEVSPTMSNEDAKNYCKTFLKEKLNDDFYNLIFDKDYLNIYSYMNIPESYKFKYNFKDNSGKINLNKGLYITIDTRYIYIQEIYLF